MKLILMTRSCPASLPLKLCPYLIRLLMLTSRLTLSRHILIAQPTLAPNISIRLQLAPRGRRCRVVDLMNVPAVLLLRILLISLMNVLPSMLNGLPTASSISVMATKKLLAQRRKLRGLLVGRNYRNMVIILTLNDTELLISASPYLVASTASEPWTCWPLCWQHRHSFR